MDPDNARRETRVVVFEYEDIELAPAEVAAAVRRLRQMPGNEVSASGVFQDSTRTANHRPNRAHQERSPEPTRADLHLTQLRTMSDDFVRPADHEAQKRFGVVENVAIESLRYQCRAHPQFTREATQLAREAIKDDPALQSYRDIRRHLTSLGHDADPNERMALLDAMKDHRDEAYVRADRRLAREMDRVRNTPPAELERRITDTAQVLTRSPDLKDVSAQLRLVAAYELGLLPPGRDTTRHLEAISTHAALFDNAPDLFERRSPKDMGDILARATTMTKEAITTEALASLLRAAAAVGPHREAATDTAYAWAIALENAR
jgi:hypothetical protein